MRMEGNKLLAALCYFSVFFAPFLFPIIVYFVTKHERVKEHAKKSFLSHLIPIAIVVATGGLFMIFAIAGVDGWIGLPFIGIVIGGIVHVVVIVWNIIKGVQVLQQSGGMYE